MQNNKPYFINVSEQGIYLTDINGYVMSADEMIDLADGTKFFLDGFYGKEELEGFVASHNKYIDNKIDEWQSNAHFNSKQSKKRGVQV